MTKWIAERKLLVAQKGASERHELTIRIGQPYLLEKGKVNCDFHEGAAGCSLVFDGINPNQSHEVYGADSLQALQMAVNVEPLLRTLSKKYDLFFPDGDPYFEAGGEPE